MPQTTTSAKYAAEHLPDVAPYTHPMFDVPRLERPLPLICGHCAHRHSYHVGTILIDNRAASLRGGKDDMASRVGFTGIFRCDACGAGGPWRLSSGTIVRLTALMLRAKFAPESAPIVFGSQATCDGFVFQYATQAEEHVRELIERDPTNAFLWRRLGNLYSHADQPKLAEPAYRRAVELDPTDVDAHSMFAELLDEQDRDLEAVPHWHAVLKHVRDARGVPLEVRKNMVRCAIERLLSTHARHRGGFELFPTMDAKALRSRERREPIVLELRNFDLSRPRDFETMCNMFLGEPPATSAHAEPQRRSREGAFLAGWLEQRRARRGSSSVSRNSPCPCGSGKWYKRCCGR